jgi:hypothetical protein
VDGIVKVPGFYNYQPDDCAENICYTFSMNAQKSGHDSKTAIFPIGATHFCSLVLKLILRLR